MARLTPSKMVNEKRSDRWDPGSDSREAVTWSVSDLNERCQRCVAISCSGPEALALALAPVCDGLVVARTVAVRMPWWVGVADE